jgi:hypothetical protein
VGSEDEAVNGASSNRSSAPAEVISDSPSVLPLNYKRSKTSSRSRRLKNQPPLHNFNLVHFKRPVSTQREHELYLQLYFKHANKSSTNYRALLMEFNAEATKELWKLGQQSYQSAIGSDLFFKDYRDITRYERQLVQALLSKEADNRSLVSRFLDKAPVMEHDLDQSRAYSGPNAIRTPLTDVHVASQAASQGTSLAGAPLLDRQLYNSSFGFFSPQGADCRRDQHASTPGVRYSNSHTPQVQYASSFVAQAQSQQLLGTSYASPLVVRPAGVKEARVKAGNQGGKGVAKVCRRCDSEGFSGVMMAGHKWPYGNVQKRRKISFQ